MKSIYDVIKGPLFTEKGTAMKETDNKVLISVATGANKHEIKQAVEEIFKVKVEGVATINGPPVTSGTASSLARPPSPKKRS